MYIEVTHTTGQVSRHPVDTSTVVQIGPQGAPTAAFSMDGVEGVELVHADLPVEPEPDITGTLRGLLDTIPVPADLPFAGPDAAVGGTLQVSDTGEPVVTPPVDPATVPADPIEAPADPPVPVTDSSPESSTPSPATTTDNQPADLAHADAVTEATSALEVAAEIPEAAAQIATEALADVEIALTSWPDSAELLDAKAKLTELAATEAS